MKGIIYNNQEQADTLKLRLKNRVKHLFEGLTSEYKRKSRGYYCGERHLLAGNLCRFKPK